MHCRWVCIVNIKLDSSIDCYKAHLLAKRYTQFFGLDYRNTFSPMAKIAYVHLFLAMAAIQHWQFHYLDIKMPSYMVSCKKFIWINLLILML